LLIHLTLTATTGKTVGKLVDKETGEALPGDNVMLIGTRLGIEVLPVEELDAVPVGKAGVLPSASFRFHLTMDTLAFG